MAGERKIFLGDQLVLLMQRSFLSLLGSMERRQRKSLHMMPMFVNTIVCWNRLANGSVSILRTEEKESEAGIPNCILIVRKRKEKK